jgi:DNA-binding transcriptional LysR family regulator
LLRGEADLALRVGPVDVPPGLIVRDLGSVGYGLYGSKAALAVPPQQYAFAGFDDSMSGAAQKQWLDRYANGRTFTLRSNDLMALYVAAKRGLGIALLPHVMVDAADGLQWLQVDGPAFARPLSLVLHPDLRRSPRVSTVVQFFSRLARKQGRVLLEPNAALVRSKQ